jgi:hypothetical protein
MALCQMRSDEPCAARNQNMHRVPPFRIFVSHCRTINASAMRSFWKVQSKQMVVFDRLSAFDVAAVLIGITAINVPDQREL